MAHTGHLSRHNWDLALLCSANCGAGHGGEGVARIFSAPKLMNIIDIDNVIDGSGGGGGADYPWQMGDDLINDIVLCRICKLRLVTPPHIVLEF